MKKYTYKKFGKFKAVEFAKVYEPLLIKASELYKDFYDERKLKLIHIFYMVTFNHKQKRGILK